MPISRDSFISGIPEDFNQFKLNICEYLLRNKDKGFSLSELHKVFVSWSEEDLHEALLELLTEKRLISKYVHLERYYAIKI